MIDDEAPWPDVSCALPDLRYAVYFAIGAAVIVAALVIVTMRKLRPW